MGNTVLVNHNEWNGQRGMLHYNLTSDGTALSAAQILDISTLGAPVPDSVKIRSIQCTLYGNFLLDILMDATTDQRVVTMENQTADVSFEFVRDFTDGPSGGWTGDKTAAGWVGDLLLTSSGMSASDGFDLLILYDAG